jgi:hypothetical protein
MANVTPGIVWTSGETVTPTKLNAAATPVVEVENDEVTTVKILDGAVTNAKLATGIDASKLTTGTLPIARIADGAITAPKLSGAQTGSAPIYGCRAWVNFDGTRNAADTGASTNGANVKIRASGNVTSVLKNGTGDYTITFTTAMPDANYCVNIVAGNTTAIFGLVRILYTGTTTTQRVLISNTSPTAVDMNSVNVAIFR